MICDGVATIPALRLVPDGRRMATEGRQTKGTQSKSPPNHCSRPGVLAVSSVSQGRLGGGRFPGVGSRLEIERCGVREVHRPHDAVR